MLGAHPPARFRDAPWGDRRTCVCGCSAVGGRSTCVQTVRLEHMKRFGMAEMFS